MSTTQPGLSALTQAVTDLTTAVNAAAADISAAGTAISTAVSDLAASEDPAAAAAAQTDRGQVAALRHRRDRIDDRHQFIDHRRSAARTRTAASKLNQVSAVPPVGKERGVAQAI